MDMDAPSFDDLRIALDLVGAAEVKALLGVSRQRTYQITQSEGFPEPVAVLSSTVVWLGGDVKAWIKANRMGRRQAEAASLEAAPSFEDGSLRIAPVRSGDVIRVAERDYSCCGSGDMTMRVTDVHGLVYLDGGPYVLVDGVRLRRARKNGGPQYAQIRVAGIRFLSESQVAAY